MPDLGASPFSTIVADNINVDGVERLLAGLLGHKARGPDGGIPARLLKESAHNMATLLSYPHLQSLFAPV